MGVGVVELAIHRFDRLVIDTRGQRAGGLLGEGGRVVGLRVPGGAAIRWTEGVRALCRAEWPALEIYEIGADYVLGRYIDPDEQVPEVRLYGLIRR